MILFSLDFVILPELRRSIKMCNEQTSETSTRNPRDFLEIMPIYFFSIAVLPKLVGLNMYTISSTK